MRLLLITSSAALGGAVASFEKIARGLLERGHEVRLVTAVPRLTDRLTGLGLPVTQLPGRKAGPRAVAALLELLRRAAIEAVLVDTLRDMRLAAYATLGRMARIVYRYNLPRRPRPRLMDRVYLSRVSAMIYQSRWIREEALAFAPRLAHKSAFRIPNGYDTTLYAPLPEAGAGFRAAHGIPPETFVVLTVATLARHKRHEVAMAALDRVRREGRPVVLVACGDGGHEADLRGFAASLELPTVFTGRLEPDGVIAALAAADLMVHSSPREVFPNAVGEAMACACPVVAVDGGGTAELLGRDGAAGLLVPPEDPDAMALAIAGLIENPERRAAMGLAARQRIETEFPLARMIDGYERALGQAIAG